MLMALLASNQDIHKYACFVLDQKPLTYGGLSSTRIIDLVLGLSDAVVEFLLKSCAGHAFLTDRFNESNRRTIAEYCGIALEREWKLTDEYLQKNKAEIVRVMEQVGLERNVDFLRYIVSKTKGAKSYEQFVNDPRLTKKDLMEAIKGSGVERKGLIPSEIKSRDNMNKFFPSADMRPFDQALYKYWTGPSDQDPDPADRFIVDLKEFPLPQRQDGPAASDVLDDENVSPRAR